MPLALMAPTMTPARYHQPPPSAALTASEAMNKALAMQIAGMGWAMASVASDCELAFNNDGTTKPAPITIGAAANMARAIDVGTSPFRS